LHQGRGMENILHGKLPEYAASGKTIFGIVPDGAAKLFIEEANGLTAHPSNIDQIAEKILELYSLWKTHQLPVPAQDFIEAHERKALTQQLAKEFENLLTVT
jgi:hypothetical protein